MIEHSTNAVAAEPAASVPSNEKEVQTISQTVVMTAASPESSNGADPLLEAGSLLPNGNVNPNFGGSSVEMEQTCTAQRLIMSCFGELPDVVLPKIAQKCQKPQ